MTKLLPAIVVSLLSAACAPEASAPESTPPYRVYADSSLSVLEARAVKQAGRELNAELGTEDFTFYGWGVEPDGECGVIVVSVGERAETRDYGCVVEVDFVAGDLSVESVREALLEAL